MRWGGGGGARDEMGVARDEMGGGKKWEGQEMGGARMVDEK